jgi:hypothetical protein
MIRVSCPRCRAVLEQPDAVAGTELPCPTCGLWLRMPEAAATGSGEPGPVVLPTSSIVPPAEGMPSEEPGRPRLPLRSRRRSRIRFRAGEDSAGFVQSALAGMICSLGGLALLVVSFFLGVVAQAVWHYSEPVIIWVALLLVVGGFVLCLLGVIFSGRGLDASNTENRGLAVTGLTCGIVGMAIGALAGLFLFCAGLLAQTARPWYWW